MFLKVKKKFKKIIILPDNDREILLLAPTAELYVGPVTVIGYASSVA